MGVDVGYAVVVKEHFDFFLQAHCIQPALIGGRCLPEVNPKQEEGQKEQSC